MLFGALYNDPNLIEVSGQTLIGAEPAVNYGGESPLLSPLRSSVGFFVPDSVDLAGHRGVGAPARRSVLGRRPVAQGRMAVAVVVLLLEVADDHAGLEQRVPVVAVEALLP